MAQKVSKSEVKAFADKMYKKIKSQSFGKRLSDKDIKLTIKVYIETNIEQGIWEIE